MVGDERGFLNFFKFIIIYFNKYLEKKIYEDSDTVEGSKLSINKMLETRSLNSKI